MGRPAKEPRGLRSDCEGAVCLTGKGEGNAAAGGGVQIRHHGGAAGDAAAARDRLAGQARAQEGGGALCPAHGQGLPLRAARRLRDPRPACALPSSFAMQAEANSAQVFSIQVCCTGESVPHYRGAFALSDH